MVPTRRHAFTLRRKERLRKRQLVCMLRLQYPHWMLKQLAQSTGFTVMRCLQILREEGLPTRANSETDVVITKGMLKVQNTLFPKTCVVCKKVLRYRLLFCSRTCREISAASLQLHSICSYCRAPFSRPAYIMRQIAQAGGNPPKLFCCVECYYNGRHEGLV